MRPISLRPNRCAAISKRCDMCRPMPRPTRVGWYSSPIFALYSGRRLGNIVTRTPQELAAASPVFLVLDTQATVYRRRPVLA